MFKLPSRHPSKTLYQQISGGGRILTDPRYGPGTLARVKEYLDYDPKTGVLTRTRSVQSRLVGQRAGFSSAKGRLVTVAGVRYEEDVICYLLGTGKIPQGQIRHLDGDVFNNRLDNLQDWICRDDPDRGVFETLKGEWEVALRTRGKSGRMTFGVYPDRDQAMAVAERGAALLGQGTDARRVKTLLKSRDFESPDATGATGRRKKDELAKYREITMDGEIRHAAYWLRHDRRIEGVGMPLYGPFLSLQEAKEAVNAYYRARYEGYSRVHALEAARMNILVQSEDRRTWNEIAPRELLSSGRLKGDPQDSLRESHDQEGIKERAVFRSPCRDGVERWIIRFLPSAPAFHNPKFFVADDDAVSMSSSAKDTWASILRYQELRALKWVHEWALKHAGLVEWDPLTQEDKPLSVMRHRDESRTVQILQDDGGMWIIRGLRGHRDFPGNPWPDYGRFETREEAMDKLEYYTKLAPYDPELQMGGHEYSLAMTGLLRMMLR